MKMKLPSLGGGVIIIKSDQKVTKKCYENSLKTKRGVCAVATRPQEVEEATLVRGDLSLRVRFRKERSVERSLSLASP